MGGRRSPFLSTLLLLVTMSATSWALITPFQFHRARVTPTSDGGNMVTVDFTSTVTPLVGILLESGSRALDTKRVTQGSSSVSVKMDSEPFVQMHFLLPDITYGLTLLLERSPAEEELPNMRINVLPQGREVTYPPGSDAVFSVVTSVTAPDFDLIRGNPNMYDGFNYYDVRSGYGGDGALRVTPKIVGLGQGLVEESSSVNKRGGVYRFRLKNPGDDPSALLSFVVPIEYDHERNSVLAFLSAVVFVPVYPSSKSELFPPGAVTFVDREQDSDTLWCQKGLECSFQCYVAGDGPGPVTLSKLGADGGLTPVGSMAKTYQGVLGFNTFRLQNVSQADAGTYACTTESAGGQVRQDFFVEVMS